MYESALLEAFNVGPACLYIVVFPETVTGSVSISKSKPYNDNKPNTIDNINPNHELSLGFNMSHTIAIGSGMAARGAINTSKYMYPPHAVEICESDANINGKTQSANVKNIEINAALMSFKFLITL